MPEWYTIVGYAGSFLIAVSLSMKNIIKLRWINLFGASTFAMYGFIVSATPVLVLNSYIALVDIYYLIKIYRTQDSFSLVPVLNDNHLYLDKFINFYSNDILKFFPDFNKSGLNEPTYLFILRNLIPAGLFVYEEKSADEIEIKLDYAIPDYRDLKNGKFIYFAESKYLKEKGYRKLKAVSSVPEHQKYLINVGFEQEISSGHTFFKQI